MGDKEKDLTAAPLVDIAGLGADEFNHLLETGREGLGKNRGLETAISLLVRRGVRNAISEMEKPDRMKIFPIDAEGHAKVRDALDRIVAAGEQDVMRVMESLGRDIEGLVSSPEIYDGLEREPRDDEAPEGVTRKQLLALKNLKALTAYDFDSAGDRLRDVFQRIELEVDNLSEGGVISNSVCAIGSSMNILFSEEVLESMKDEMFVGAAETLYEIFGTKEEAAESEAAGKDS